MSPEIKLKRIGLAARKFKSKTSGGRILWPEEFRQRVIALIIEGIGLTALSQATGIASGTLQIWRDQSKSKSNSASFKKLKVVDRPKSVVQTRGPVKIFVTTSQGSEIQGLGADDVARLIRRGVL